MQKHISSLTLAAAGAGLLWAGVAAQQDARPVPSLGTGVVRVTGTVDIGDNAHVRAAQEGEWRVAVTGRPEVRIANTPTVSLAGPAFIKQGAAYTVTWAAGDRESIVVVDVAGGNWVQVEKSGGSGERRWINLMAARSIETAPSR